MKENNGKAARRQFTKRVLVAGGLASVFCFVLYANSSHDAASQPRQKAAEALRQLDTEKVPWHHEHFHHLDGAEPKDELLEKIMTGELNLVDIHSEAHKLPRQPGDYGEAVFGHFCKLNFPVHKKDPSGNPMFRDLVAKSPDCDKPRVMNLKQVVAEAHRRDAEGTGANVLQLAGVVFHESRCGSTLVANMCMAANPDEHRVYSESAPPLAALRSVCGENYDTCSLETAAAVLKDVIYLMSRSDDPKESKVFFKIQSLGTRNLKVFLHAFPATPWLFVYREPVQVMMSQLAHGVRNANCVRSKRSRSMRVEEIADRHGVILKHISDEDYCAVHLATITEMAADNLNEFAIPVNYRDLTNIFADELLPKMGVNLAAEGRRRVEAISGVYSKGRGSDAGEFHGDSEEKEKRASKEVRQAAQTYLQESYERLERAVAAQKK